MDTCVLHKKFYIFTAMKYCSILYGRVIVMMSLGCCHVATEERRFHCSLPWLPSAKNNFSPIDLNIEKNCDKIYQNFINFWLYGC